MQNTMYSNSHEKDEYVPFPEIGQGSQYHAYDLHDGRVLKIPLTREETYLVVSNRRHNINPRSTEEVANLDSRVHTLLNGKGRIPNILSHEFSESNDFHALLGNPRIIESEHVLPEDTPEKQWGVGRVVYTQDKALMNHQILAEFDGLHQLKSGDIKKLKQIIELYIEQTYKLWSYGYADYVFKLGDTGFNTQGDFIFVDLGEFSTDPTFILRALQEQRWLHAIMPGKIDFPQVPLSLQTFYQETLAHAFTPESFQKYWRTRHECDNCKPSSDVVRTFIAAKAAEIDYIDRW